MTSTGMEVTTMNLSNASTLTTGSPTGVHHPDIGFCVFMAFCFVAGIVGNVIVFLVYQKKDESSSTLFIKALATIDLIVCAIVGPYNAFNVLGRISHEGVCKAAEFVRHATLAFSVGILLSIAIDRYSSIARPYRFGSMPPKFSKFLIILSTLVAIGVSVPAVFFYHMDEREAIDGWTGTLTLYTSCSSHTDVEQEKRLYVIFMITLMVLYLMNLICMGVLYILLYIYVFKTSQFRESVMKKGSTPGATWVQAKRRHVREPDHTPSSTAGIVSSESFSNSNSADNDDEPPSIANNNDNKSKAAVYTITTPTAPPVADGNVKLRVPEATLPREREVRAGRSSIVIMSRRRVHLKIAKILLVVTVVFALTWIPHWLTSMQFVPFSWTFFHFYVANSVANPLVYSFMNRRFRQDVWKLFKCKCSRWYSILLKL